MAAPSKITIRVRAARGSDRVDYATTGRYRRLQTAGVRRELLQQPIQPTSTQKAWLLGVLALITADVEANL